MEESDESFCDVSNIYNLKNAVGNDIRGVCALKSTSGATPVYY